MCACEIVRVNSQHGSPLEHGACSQIPETGNITKHIITTTTTNEQMHEMGEEYQRELRSMLVRMSCMEHDFIVRGRGLTSLSAGLLEETASSLAGGGGGGVGLPGSGLFGALDGEDEAAGAAAAVAAVAAATEAEREAATATAGDAVTQEVSGGTGSGREGGRCKRPVFV